MKAIITYARGWNALAAARSLGKRGVDIVAGDERGFSPTGFSRYTSARFVYPSPEHEPAAFLDTLEKVIRAQRPADGELVLMPVHKETTLIARHRARFEALGVKLAIPDVEAIEAVHDKGILAETCARLGVPMARTYLPRTPREADEVAAHIAYPAFVKLRRAAAAVGVIKVGDAVELGAAWRDLADRYRLSPEDAPIVQEGVPGDDYCATFLFERGQLRAAMTYHNLRTFPAGSGTGVLRETVSAPAIERIGADLLAKLGWHGVAEIDFRWDGTPDAAPQMIEVNPRFWGGLPQCVAAGLDYPWLLYRLAVDGRVATSVAAPSAVRTETPVMAALATVHAVRHPDAHDLLPWARRAARLARDHRRTVSDVLSLRDPLPALGVLYPLGVFLRHGRLSTGLLVSEGEGAADRDAA